MSSSNESREVGYPITGDGLRQMQLSFTFIAGALSATTVQSFGITLFSGMLVGVLLSAAAAASFLFQPGSKTEMDMGLASSSAMVASKEERVDPGSIAALLKESNFLAYAVDQTPVTSRANVDAPKLSIEEAERQLVDSKARAKERLKALKALGQWAKDFQEAQKAHSKQLEKLADSAASNIVNLFGPVGASLSTPEQPVTKAVTSTKGGNTSASMDVPRSQTTDRQGLTAATPLQLWFRSLAGHTRHRSREASALGDLGADTLLETANKMGAEQALLEKRCSAHGNALVLERQKATAAKAAADRAQTAAEERFRVHVEKMVAAQARHLQRLAEGDFSRDDTSATHKSEELSAKADVAERLRLQRLADGAEVCRREADSACSLMNDRFQAEMPRILGDFEAANEVLEFNCQKTLQAFGAGARGALGPILEAQARFEEDIALDSEQCRKLDLASARRVGVDLPHAAIILPTLKQLESPEMSYSTSQPSKPSLSSTPSPEAPQLSTTNESKNNAVSTDGASALQLTETSASNSPGGAAKVPAVPQPKGMAMNSYAAAAVAATLPAALPPMPAAAVNAVGEESCVWLNAFLGRVYRDCARSPHFHNWMASRLEHNLNKGWKNKPDFCDEVSVQMVGFGPTPPLVTNARWLPTCAMAGSDLEHDVGVDANLRFKGGFSFVVTTRFWVNWPRPKSASMPMQVLVRLTEISGAVRFGVTRDRTFVSFLGEPYSSFEVKSSFGSKSAKVQNMKRLDAVILKQIQTTISRKLVWPKKHTFRLFWPRSWWPAALDSSTSLDLVSSTLSSSNSTDPEDKKSTTTGGESPLKTKTMETTAAPPSENGKPAHAEVSEKLAHLDELAPENATPQHTKDKLPSSEAHSLVSSPGDLMLTQHQSRPSSQAPARMGMGFSRMRRYMGKPCEIPALGEVPLLKDLSEAERSRVVRQFKRATFKKGQVIVQAGAADDRFFVVGRGTVLLTNASSLDSSMEVTAGAYFGELSLLDEKSKMVATATAKTDVTAYFLTPEVFSQNNRIELGGETHKGSGSLRNGDDVNDSEVDNATYDDCEVPFDELLAATNTSQLPPVDRENVDWGSIIRMVADGIRPTIADESEHSPAAHVPLKLPDLDSSPKMLPKPLSSASSLCNASSRYSAPLVAKELSPAGKAVAAPDDILRLGTFDSSSLSKRSFSTQAFVDRAKSTSLVPDSQASPKRRHSVGDFHTHALFQLVLLHSPQLGGVHVAEAAKDSEYPKTEVKNLGGWQRNLDERYQSSFIASLSDDDSESSSDDDDSLQGDSGRAPEGRRSWSAKWANLKQTASQKAQAALEARRARKLAKKGFTAVTEVVAGSSDEEQHNVDALLPDNPASEPVESESALSIVAGQPVTTPPVVSVTPDPSTDSTLEVAPPHKQEASGEDNPEGNAVPTSGSWRDRLKKNVMAKVEEHRERKNAKADLSATSEKVAPSEGAPSSPGSSFEDNGSPNAKSNIQAKAGDESSITSSQLDRTAEGTPSTEAMIEPSKKSTESWRDRLKKNVMAKVEERRERKSAKSDLSATSGKIRPSEGASSSPGSFFEDNDTLLADSVRSADEAVRSLAETLRGLDHTLNPWFLEALTTHQRIYASKWVGQWRKGVGAGLPESEESAQEGFHQASAVSDQCWWLVERPSDHDAAFTFELVNASSARRLFARRYTPHRWTSKVTRPSLAWKKHVGAGPPGKTYPDNLWRALPHPESATNSPEVSFMIQNVHSGRFLFSLRKTSAASNKTSLEESRKGAEASEKSGFSFGAVGASQVHEAEFLANAAWQLVACNDGLQGTLPPQEGVMSTLTTSEMNHEDSDSQDESDGSDAEETHAENPLQAVDVTVTSKERTISVPDDARLTPRPDV